MRGLTRSDVRDMSKIYYCDHLDRTTGSTPIDVDIHVECMDCDVYLDEGESSQPYCQYCHSAAECCVNTEFFWIYSCQGCETMAVTDLEDCTPSKPSCEFCSWPARYHLSTDTHDIYTCLNCESEAVAELEGDVTYKDATYL